MMENDDRILSWMARDIRKNRAVESEITDFVAEIQGPVWLSIDIDALDPSNVPATGTPVPGGLDYWFVNEIIERLFSGTANVVGADVSEIVPDDHGVTQFTAATIATSILAGVCYRNGGE
jgi:agmatinase